LPRLLRRWQGSHKLRVIARDAKVLRHGAGAPELDRMLRAGRPLLAGQNEYSGRMSVPASSADAPLPLAAGGTSRIYWKFTLGHRHAAQFHNLKESYLPEVRDRLIWVGKRIQA
jgi:hypothetical protein